MNDIDKRGWSKDMTGWIGSNTGISVWMYLYVKVIREETLYTLVVIQKLLLRGLNFVILSIAHLLFRCNQLSGAVIWNKKICTLDHTDYRWHNLHCSFMIHHNNNVFLTYDIQHTYIRELTPAKCHRPSMAKCHGIIFRWRTSWFCM